MPSVDNSMLATSAVAAGYARSSGQARAPEHHGFSFSDVLDIINPLQHFPVVGTLYRKLTGDTIGAPEKIVGDFLYGGALGFVSSLADTAFESATGQDFGDTVFAMLAPSADKAQLTAVEPQPEMLELSASAPALSLADASSAHTFDAQGNRAPTEEAVTAALNRAQIDKMRSDRSLFAYARAATLSQSTPRAATASAF